MKVIFTLLLLVVSIILILRGVHNVKRKSGSTWLFFIMAGSFLFCSFAIVMDSLTSTGKPLQTEQGQKTPDFKGNINDVAEHKCLWCQKTYYGNGYNHLYGTCEETSEKTQNFFCSYKCCKEDSRK